MTTPLMFTQIVAISTTMVILLAGCKQSGPVKIDIDQRVKLTGMLQYEMFYGAPGFGEDTANDAKEPSYILHLSNPILFRDTVFKGITYDTVTTIQVRYDPHSKVNGENLRSLTGKKVTIECTLYGAENGYHHAPALTEKVYSLTAKTQ